MCPDTLISCSMILKLLIFTDKDFPDGSAVRNLPAMQANSFFNLWVEKVSSRKKWEPSPVFLLGKSHAQRSLAGYSLYYCKDSEMTE